MYLYVYIIYVRKRNRIVTTHLTVILTVIVYCDFLSTTETVRVASVPIWFGNMLISLKSVLVALRICVVVFNLNIFLPSDQLISPDT